ncbi:MAG: tetratricopeptide repeat protein [Proteobacteria bacterium]|nr:tetratricopeptide repeat protein [Pseudomonadota bacterium]
MTSLYRLPAPVMLAILAVTALLQGCASLPSGRREAAREQPLQHMALPPVAADDDVLAMKLAGQFALDGGDVAGAAREFSRAASRGADPALADEAVQVAIAAREWDLARSGIARWQQLRADDPALWQARARVALHDDKADAALEDLRRLAHEPDGKGWSAIGRVLVASGDNPQAGALLQKLATADALGEKSATWVAVSELAEHLRANTLAATLARDAIVRFNDAPTHVWGAELKLRSGDKAGARALFVEALKRSKDDVHLRAAYAQVLAQMGENDEAARVLAQGKQDDYTYAARAAYAARASDKSQIALLYEELLADRTPRSGVRLNLLGQLAELLGHKSEALDWYAKVPADDEHWPQARLRTALLLDRTGHTTPALDLLHQLQARSGDDDKQVGDAFLMEAEILDRHQRGEAAIAVYDRGLQALPDDPRLLYARALLNDDLDHIDAAVRDLRRLLVLQPDNADALNALGYTLADRTKEQAEALTLIEKALALKPDEPAIIDSLGWVQYRLGHLQEAVARLRTAYAKQPDPEIAAHLGEVLWVSGDKTEARKIWAQGQKKDARNKVLLETMKRLES